MCKDARNYASVCVAALCENSGEKEKDLRRANTGKATNDDHHQDEAWQHDTERKRVKRQERKKQRKAKGEQQNISCLRFKIS